MTDAEMFDRARDYLLGVARAQSMSQDPIAVNAWALWESILTRPRCRKCSNEVNPVEAMCFACGSIYKEGSK